MVDYEPRPYATCFPDHGQQNGYDNTSIPSHLTGYYSSFEEANIGGGDHLFDLECRLATSLSKELLSALEDPIQRPLPDFERNKVACLKNAILELKRENDALHQELRRVELNEEERKRRFEPPRPPQPRSAGGPAPKEPSHRGLERDVACQTEADSLRGHEKSHESVAASTEAEPRKKHTQVSSHSKCVDWLKQRKSLEVKSDKLHFVRSALWQLWELADRALTQKGSSKDDFRVQRLEDDTEKEEEEEGKELSGTPSSEVEQLRLQLARLQKSTDRLKRRRAEQATLLRQREVQVSRLQRSRSQLTRTFERELLKLRQQQTIEVKALQLQMQTERASLLAGQSAQMEQQLQNAVAQLEERYRGLLREAFHKKSDSKLNSRPCSSSGKHFIEESGT